MSVVDAKVVVQLPDGTEKQFLPGVTCRVVAASIGAGLLKAAMAAVVDGQIVGLDHVLPTGHSVALQILKLQRCRACVVCVRQAGLICGVRVCQ